MVWIRLKRENANYYLTCSKKIYTGVIVPILSIKYNIWSNAVNVCTNLNPLICTENDAKYFLFDNYFNKYLYWDIIYCTYNPKIKFDIIDPLCKNSIDG